MQTVYAIYDRVVGTFMTPFPAPNDGSATRSVQDALMKGGPLKEHAADYELNRLGTYDEATGQLVGLVKPEVVLRLNSLVPNA